MHTKAQLHHLQTRAQPFPELQGLLLGGTHPAPFGFSLEPLVFSLLVHLCLPVRTLSAHWQLGFLSSLYYK